MLVSSIFSLFPQHFLLFQDQISIFRYIYFANAFSLDQWKILLFGKELSGLWDKMDFYWSIIIICIMLHNIYYTSFSQSMSYIYFIVYYQLLPLDHLVHMNISVWRLGYIANGFVLEGWLVVLGFNATFNSSVTSWRSVTHMCFQAFSHQY